MSKKPKHELENNKLNKRLRHADRAGVDLSELPLEDLQSFSDLINEDVYNVLTPEGSLNARNHLGGTAPEQVRRQVARWRGLIAG